MAAVAQLSSAVPQELNERLARVITATVADTRAAAASATVMLVSYTTLADYCGARQAVPEGLCTRGLAAAGLGNKIVSLDYDASLRQRLSAFQDRDFDSLASKAEKPATNS